MSEEVIKIDGEDVIVREDTAKSYRGVIWALSCVGALILILSILLFGGFLRAASDGKIETPAQLENSSRR